MGEIEKMIEIEGLPEGWKAIAYRRPYPQEYILKSEGAMKVRIRGEQPWLIIERIKPHRVVLEKTEEKHLGCQTLYIDDTEFMIMTDKVWREVKENDLSLNKDEPKLSLSVGDVKRILSNTLYCEDIVNRMREFLKEN